MDFFAITDHSDSFENCDQGSICTDGSTVSADWAAGKSAAAASTTDSFVAMFGYELNWPSQMQIGHISTFGTAGFQSWTQSPYNTYSGALDSYYEALSSTPDSVSQFNHPGTAYGTFDGFTAGSETALRTMSLLELDLNSSKPIRYYTKALDQGWYLAPTVGQSIFSSSWTDTSVRTVIYAQSLTEADILSALKQRRTYATEDRDLEILYSMDGYLMGSALDLRHVGETADISVTVRDPSDSAIGLAEVITNGGAVIAQQSLDSAQGTFTFSLPPTPGYYFLRITQPDGDLAVTAPIWIDGEEALGIVSFTCETSVPVQNEPVSLTLVLNNSESADFLVDSLRLLADGDCILTDSSLTRIPAQSTISHPVTLSCDCAGITEITACLSGTLDGNPQNFEVPLTLSFRQSSQVTAIMADGSHGNAGLDQLNILRQMAMDQSIQLTVQSADISPQMLKDCRFLLVSAPSQQFSSDFLAAVTEFADFGGSIVLCAQAVENDAGLLSAQELNRLLEAVGSTIRFNSDTVRDAVNNGGTDTLLHSDQINTGLSWCGGISQNQVYRAASGCSIRTGSGTWVVQGSRSAVSSASENSGNVTLMACESLSGGGTVFASGSLFLSDDSMEDAKNIWAEPYANRTIAQSLLGIGGEAVPLSTIAQARTGEQSTLFRVQGYVTAGTSNPYNTFPDTLYIQDNTGGIAVMPFSGASIQQGTPMEITGFTDTRNGNRILKVSTWKVLDDSMYQYQPLTGSWDALLDPAVNGGRLVEVEGVCREVYCREDDTLSGCLLEDEAGNTAIIKIEDSIFNGSDGENDLHKSIRRSRTVRAMGLLHTDDYGNTVIRVRNCEEVVYVPPLRIFSLNPRTADPGFSTACSLMILSLAGLLLMRRRKRA